MLVGQQLGPFLIEKELGAGAMGAVYRGKYVETGQTVAIKIMAPGLGTSSDGANKRFKREADILKQLKHPNIVRLFAIGKHRGTAYYAMEYVEGESLDHVMARRDRMSWEEVVDLGQQLCKALQHAHEKGIVHRDLKPSNLMILADGTLKLTDFGIAKDLDVTSITGANCTIGTAAYMSPEQCRGDPDIGYKSDLYSLGIVFYELITGRKPFIAENAMEMFMLHVNGECQRPSRIVLDLPVWMDTLICQLMEKKPEHRPIDAAMVSQVLGSIQDKVEAQQAAGIDAARARLLDSPRGKRNVSDEDRDAARTLLNKPKSKRKKKKKNRRLPIWVQAAGLVFLLAGVITALVIALQPPGADALYKEAERLMVSSDTEKHDSARDGPIKEFLRRFAGRNDAQAEQMRKWADDYDIGRYEQLIARYLNHEKGKTRMAVEAKNEGEQLIFKAASAEDKGDIDGARQAWKQAVEAGSSTIGLLARRHLEYLDRIGAAEKELERERQDAIDKRAEPAPTKLDELSRQALLALRQERLGDQVRMDPQKIGDQDGARRRYLLLRTAAEAGTSEVQRFWALFAAVKARKMDDYLIKNPDARETDKRKVRLGNILAAAQKAAGRTDVRHLDRRAVFHDVELLFEQEAEMASLVKDAKAKKEEIDKIFSGGVVPKR
jgi:eukaryotic-like serine/threonine-protein kinase